MPEKSVLLSNITINFTMVVVGVFTIASSYITILLKNVNGKIERQDEKIVEIKTDIKNHNDILSIHYDRLKDLELIQIVVKTEHDSLLAEHKQIHKKGK